MMAYVSKKDQTTLGGSLDKMTDAELASAFGSVFNQVDDSIFSNFVNIFLKKRVGLFKFYGKKETKDDEIRKLKNDVIHELDTIRRVKGWIVPNAGDKTIS